MATAKRDNNGVPTLIALNRTDGATPIKIYANPTSHRLILSQLSASFTRTTAKKDDNTVPTANGVSNSDGVTPVQLAADSSTGGLLADIN